MNTILRQKGEHIVANEEYTNVLRVNASVKNIIQRKFVNVLKTFKSKRFHGLTGRISTSMALELVCELQAYHDLRKVFF